MHKNLGIPLVGLGTFKLRADIDNEIVYHVLDTALSTGYRLFDTASCYRNEKDIGDALQRLYTKHNISRSDIFITSKLAPKDMGLTRTVESCMQSIADLQCTYLDCYLIHWPGRAKLKPADKQHSVFRKETWMAFEKLKLQGFVRNIGVSNFTVKHLKELLEYAEVRPVINQVEFHIHLHQIELLNFCQSEGIFLQSYSSLGTGILLKEPMVIELAEKYNQTPGQILLKWVLQQGVGVIPKSIQSQHIRSNYETDQFSLVGCDMEKLSQQNLDKHYCWDPSLIQ